MPLHTKGRGRISSLASIESYFLESVLPVRAIAHLTTRCAMAEDRLIAAFLAWIRGIQGYHGFTLGWVRGIERNPQRHIHAVLIAAHPVDCHYAAGLWRTMAAPRYSRAAVVEPYRRSRYGMGYVIKQLGSPAESIQYSNNIAAFGPGGKSLFRTDAADRRQQRRIRAQLDRGDCRNGFEDTNAMHGQSARSPEIPNERC